MIRNEIKAGLLAAFVACSATGCSESGDDYDVVEDRNAEIVANLLDAGFSEDEIEVREALSVDDQGVLGEPQLQVFVDGDTHVTLEASREMVDALDNEFRHWRTPNLVQKNKTICLARITSAQAPFSSYKLNDKMKTAVNAAKNSYNAISGVSLTFKVGNGSLNSSGVLSHNISGCDHSIFIYKVSNNNFLGSSGFPSGGAPYNQVQLSTTLNGQNAAVHKHVATHEIGHAIGLRHTDWKTRSSCGGPNVNEGKMGAVQIDNTPNQTENSIMASCVSPDTNGNFRGKDKAALKKIY